MDKRARVSSGQSSLFRCLAVPAGYARIGPPLKTKRTGGGKRQREVAKLPPRERGERGETKHYLMLCFHCENTAFCAPRRNPPVCPLSPLICPVIPLSFRSIFLFVRLSRGFDFRVINEESRDREGGKRVAAFDEELQRSPDQSSRG